MMMIKKSKRMRSKTVMQRILRGIRKAITLKRPNRSHLKRNKSQITRLRNRRMRRRKNSASATSLTIIFNCLGSTYPSAMMKSG
jgi:hypothetical protein